jgi:FlaA1/EpsC-like NDP-sugar epimerase
VSTQKTGPKWHRLLLPVIDGALLNAAVIVALWLRFEGGIPSEWWLFYERTAVWLTPFLLISCWLFGLYNRVWEYARGEAAVSIVVAVIVGIVLGWLGVWYTSDALYSRSVLAMTLVLTMLGIGGSRFAWRQIRRMVWKKTNGDAVGDCKRVLIYGAGHAGTSFVRQLETSPNNPYIICGFIDDSPGLQGMIVGTHKVLGTGEDLAGIVKAFEIDQVILAAPSASGQALRQMRDYVTDADAEVRTLPRLLETVQGEVATGDVRQFRYEDLLGRDMTDVQLDLDPNYVEDRKILITGAGGSIGSEICRQLCRYNPGQLILLGRGENRIHGILRELEADWPGIDCRPVICNFTNGDHVERIFQEHEPQVVFHAGAHKHVYLMENHPTEAVRNNVVGTGIVARAADRAGVDRFVAISTDKAVEPCNVMGASKRLCEILIQKINRESDTKFMAVRFGNVIGSSGSVLTIFENQAASGRPLTVTHPEATRFFMTVEEAAFLVLHAGAIGTGGDIFVLEMGEPVCIHDMACEFLEMHGRDPEAPGSIIITDLRPGEKVHEILCSTCEELEPTPCDRINRVARNGHVELDGSFEELLAHANDCATNRPAAEALLNRVCEPTESTTRTLEGVVEAAGG